MKGIIYHIVFVIGLLMPFAAQSQSVLKPEYASLWTDRAIYITGESIKFSGIIEGENSLSKVAYTELITPSGSKVNQNKLQIIDGLYTGNITIPSEILSGYYYLRSYTKWMRNGSPKNYAYVLVKIINPYNNEVLSIPDSLIDNDIIRLDDRNVKLKDSIFSIENYKPKDKISISINHQGNIISHISVIPEIAQAYEFKTQLPQLSNYSQLVFYPETRGITLSGKVESKNSAEPLAFHLLSIHILGEKDLISVLSDSTGRFYFALPERFGQKELFMIAASLENDEAKIEIDQDFCYKDITLKVPEFAVPENEKAAILNMVQNQQVFDVFNEVDSIKSVEMNYKAFYGKAIKTIDFSFYILLDSLEQYLTDIPSWVLVKKQEGKRYFQIVGEQGELKLYKPLVLVDWVPIDDADRVLAIHPAVVDRIDVITQSYIHGNKIYGGVINVLTKNTDFGGLKFPESGMYLNLGFYSEAGINMTIKTEFKNTYYWMPNIIQDSLFGKIEFIAPQQKGKFILLIQGIDKSGNDFSKQNTFNIK